VQGDHAYHSGQHKKALQECGIEPVLAERNTEHGSGLGVHRWVVERSLSWLHQFRRLRVRHERRSDIHEAYMTLDTRVHHDLLENTGKNVLLDALNM